MSKNEDEIRIEVGFEGSQIMSAVVPSKDADELEAALAARKDGSVVLEAEDGRYTVALDRVVYLKRFHREGTLGFSG